MVGREEGPESPRKLPCVGGSLQGACRARHPGSKASCSSHALGPACGEGRCCHGTKTGRTSAATEAVPTGRAITPDGADRAGPGHSPVAATSSSGCRLAERSGFARRHSDQPTSQPAQCCGPVPGPGGVTRRHSWPLGGTGGSPRSREHGSPPEAVAAAQVRFQLAGPSPAAPDTHI